MRGRLVRATSAEPDDLRVLVELDNVGPEPRAIHWDGRPNAGFIELALDDAAGHEVPEPAWRLGGNEPGGGLRLELPAGATTRLDIAAGFAQLAGRRILRVGAFWGREMPADGASRWLRGRVVGRAPSDDDVVVTASPDDPSVTIGAEEPSPARAWSGPLDLPSLCIE